MSSARSTWGDNNSKCVEVFDVVSFLQEDLTELKERLGSHHSQIDGLQLLLKNAQLELKDLERPYQEMRTATQEALQTYQALLRRWHELNAQLAAVAGQQKRSLETIMSLKASVKQLSHDCSALTVLLSRAQALSTGNETEGMRTFLTFTSDVQAQPPEVHPAGAAPAVPRLMLAHAISQPRKLGDVARSDSGPLTARREQTPAAANRPVREPEVCLPDDDALAEWEMKRSAEIKELKASVRQLEQRLIPEKEKLVSAQARVNQKRNRNQSVRTQEEIDSSAREFRSMKKRQREMEDEIRRLKEMHGVVQPTPTVPDDVSEDLRIGLLEGRHKVSAGPGWLGTVVPQLGQRLRCSAVSQGGFESLQRARFDAADTGSDRAEPQLQGRARLLIHPEF
jgi:predicted  nucleic acid-binding Zn-ribbon protein